MSIRTSVCAQTEDASKSAALHNKLNLFFIINLIKLIN